jgi:hypothetical protein
MRTSKGSEAGTSRKRAPAAPSKSAGYPSPDTGGRRGILVRLDRTVWRELKLIALNEDTTLQALMEEAIAELLKRRRR